MIGRPAVLEHEQLFVLLLKLAVAASLASILVRFGAFQRMLMRKGRTVMQRFKLALCFAAAFGSGVAARVLVPAYQAVDLGLEGSLLSGLVGGYQTGLLAGILISVPAMFKGELVSMPLFAAVGVLGGLLHDIAPDEEEIWRLSPYLNLSFARLFRARLDLRRTAFQLACLATIVFAELLRFTVAALFESKGVFSLSQSWGHPKTSALIAIYLTTAFAVILPLKIWNNSRNEKKLETQQLSLDQARLAALMSQINPHFLFNTLNSVSSLIRTNPDQARTVVYKIGRILRRLLRKNENMTPLREELSFIEDYLAIEMVRFGSKLKFVKE